MGSPFHIRRRVAKFLSWLAGLSLGSFFITLILAILVLAIFVRTEFFQEALRDRIVSAVQQSIQADIEYESAAVEVFRFYPRVVFREVQITDSKTEVDVAIDRISVSISLFVSLPLLLFKEILIDTARVEGLQYELRDLSVIDQWLQRIRPKGSKIKTAFKTRIRNIEFRHFDLVVSLEKSDRLNRDLSGRFRLDRFDIELDGDDFWLNGEFGFTDFVSGGYQLESGSLEIEDILYTKEFAEFDRIYLQSGEDFLELSGTLKNWKSPELDLDLSSSFRLEDYSEVSPAKGRVRLEASASGKPQSLKGFLKVESKDLDIKGRRFDSALMESEFLYPQLNLKKLSIQTGNENISAQGQIDIKSFQLKDFHLDLSQVDLGQGLRMLNDDRKTWTGKIDGQIKLGGGFGKGQSVAGQAKLSVENFGVYTTDNSFVYGAPPSQLEADLVLNSFKEGSFEVAMVNDGGSWTGGGEWKPGYFNIFWDGDLNGGRQGDLFQFELEVLGQLKGSYGGPLNRMVIDMDINTPEFELDDHMFTNVQGKLRFVDRVLFGDPITFSGGEFTGGLFFPKFDNTEFRDFSFKFSQQNLQTVFSSLDQVRDWPMQPIGDASGSGVLNGWIRMPYGEGVVLGQDIRFDRDRTRGRLGKANWKFDDGVLYFDKVFIQTSTETGGVNGKVSFIIKGIKDFDLRGREVRVGDWLPLTGLEIPLQALTDFTMSYRRETDSFLGNFELKESFLGGQTQDNSNVRVEVDASRSEVYGELFGERIIVKMNERISRTLESVVQFRDFDLVDYFEFISDSGLEYRLNGDGICRIQFEDPFIEMKAYEKFFATINQYNCDFGFKADNIMRARQSLHEVEAFDMSVLAQGEELIPRYSFKNLRVKTDDKILLINGYYRSPTDISLRLNGETTLESLSYAMPAVDRASGGVGIDGFWSQNGYTGSIDIFDGFISFEDSPINIRQVSAQLRAQDSDFDLLSLSGQFRDGGVTGRGQFSLDGFDIDSARMNFQLNGPLIEPDRGVRFQASGPIRVIIDDDALISGELQIYNATYRKRINLRSDLMNFFEREDTDKYNFFTKEAGYFDDWNLDVGLVTSEPVNIRNNLAEGDFDLRLRINGQVKDPRLVGSVQILNGSFNYFNRDFEIQSGSIQFSDPNSNIPRYEIRAEAEVDVYRVFVSLIGDRSEQRIIYSSDPPLQEKEILALVSYGTPPEDQDNIRVDDPTASAAFTGISFFTGQLQDTIEGALSTDLGIQRFQLYPAFFEDTGKTELQLKIGTDLIRNRLELNYYNFVSADGGHQVELDLKINRYMSLVSSWRDSKEDQDEAFSGDLGSDVIFRFEVE